MIEGTFHCSVLAMSCCQRYTESRNPLRYTDIHALVCRPACVPSKRSFCPSFQSIFSGNFHLCFSRKFWFAGGYQRCVCLQVAGLCRMVHAGAPDFWAPDSQCFRGIRIWPAERFESDSWGGGWWWMTPQKCRCLWKSKLLLGTSRWQVITRAEMIEYHDISGCPKLRRVVRVKWSEWVPVQ